MAATRNGSPINVPASGAITWVGTNFVAAGIYYDGANQAVTAFGGANITVDGLVAVPSGSYMGVYFAWGRINSTGADTITRTKAGFYSEGPTLQVQCYDCSDPASFTLRDYEVIGNWPDTGGAISATIDTESGDLVDAWIMSDGGGTVSTTISGFTAVGTEQTVNADKSRVYQGGSIGSPSKSITGPNNSFAGLAIVSVYEDTGGGGSDTQVESITFSDSITAAMNADRAVSETITFSDVVAAELNTAAALTETLAFSDSIVAALAFEDTIDETLTFTDSVDAELVSGGVVAESITFTESIDAELTAVAAQDETLVFTDTVDGELTAAADLTEELIFEDVVEGVVAGEGLQVESITFDDSVEAVAGFEGLVDETIAFEDVVDALAPGEVDQVEQITFQDTVEAVLAAQATIEETLVWQDVVSVAEPPPEALEGDGGVPWPLPRKRKLLEDADLLDPLRTPAAEPMPTRKAPPSGLHRFVQVLAPKVLPAPSAPLQTAAKPIRRLDPMLIAQWDED